MLRLWELAPGAAWLHAPCSWAERTGSAVVHEGGGGHAAAGDKESANCSAGVWLSVRAGALELGGNTDDRSRSTDPSAVKQASEPRESKAEARPAVLAPRGLTLRATVRCLSRRLVGRRGAAGGSLRSGRLTPPR